MAKSARVKSGRGERAKTKRLRKKGRLGKMESVSVFDLLVTIFLVTATFWGGLRGVVSQISAIATWVLSVLAAARHGSAVDEIVSIPEPWRASVSALIVFCATALALSVAFRFVKRAVSLSGLKEFDRQAGALFGLIKGCAICVALTFFCVLTSEKTRDLVDNSKTGPYLASVSLLLKDAFPKSETMTRFEELVSSMESSQAKSELPSLKSEVAGLEAYLKENVLSDEAVDVVEEADAGEKGGTSSGWDRFLSDLRGWGDGFLGSATDAANSTRNGDVGNGGWKESGGNGAGGEEKSGRGDRTFWRGNASSANEAKYDVGADRVDYRNGGNWENGGDQVVRAEYGNNEERVESLDWTPFLTNLTVGTETTTETYRTSETSGRFAAFGESLNEFLGVVPSRGAGVRRETSAPTFDSGVRRTNDGAGLGRSNSTSTPLIPPLPY